MSNVRIDDPWYVADVDTELARDARNRDERRATFDWCLTNVWADRDIGRIERFDESGWHGWAMWGWKRR